MRLVAVTIQKFRNFVAPQRIEIESDVTCLVGKNESGKTTVLKALHRLNPANGTDKRFDLTTEYPRWRLAKDRRADPNLKHVRPVMAEFVLTDDELTKLQEIFDIEIPSETKCFAAKSYANRYNVWVRCSLEAIFRHVAQHVSLHEEELPGLLKSSSISEAQAAAKDLAKELRDSNEPLRAKAVTAFSTLVGKYQVLRDSSKIEQEQLNQIAALVPKFFYFSAYNVLPGECDLNKLAAKLDNEEELSDSERTVVALLAHAGEEPRDFMDEDYDSRKAELQAASVDLSRNVFEYWKQNTDLEVVFDTDNVVVHEDPQGNQRTHRVLKIELRDGRHGNVETNFSTRSSGFQWFFSFFAAFSEYQHSDDSVIVLLDEPGTSLHGDAQRDFIRYIFDELGASKQTVYTTHSQHMVDPTKYEKLRAVHDRATRQNPDLGVVVTRADLAADRDTILPIESALGYSISQHLFIGSGQHLAVEGSSDFVYLQRMTEFLLGKGKIGLDPRLAVIPVGGADNMPVFVALLGRRLKVSALIDGAKSNSKIARVKAAAKHNDVPETSIIACSEVSDVPTNADIEDMFDVKDYLKLYNWAFNAAVKVSDLPATTEPIIKKLTDVKGEYDHAQPAHALTMHRDEFFSAINAKSVARFEKLFQLLNATVQE
jgi:predicted ATP-dependent endonuclease of OLD family